MAGAHDAMKISAKRGFNKGVPLTKADLEFQFHQFTSHAQQCEAYHRAGDFLHSLQVAGASLSFADGMLQYSKRFGSGPPKNICTAEYIMQYAPLLFHRLSLEQLDDSISASRRVAKGETWDYTHAVSMARAQMNRSRSLWNALEERGELRAQDIKTIFGNAAASTLQTAKLWMDIGLISPVSDCGSNTFRLATSLGRPCSGKCANCGEVSTAPKSLLLEETNCPNCGTSTHFVLIG